MTLLLTHARTSYLLAVFALVSRTLFGLYWGRPHALSDIEFEPRDVYFVNDVVDYWSIPIVSERFTWR